MSEKKFFWKKIYFFSSKRSTRIGRSVGLFLLFLIPLFVLIQIWVQQWNHRWRVLLPYFGGIGLFAFIVLILVGLLLLKPESSGRLLGVLIVRLLCVAMAIALFALSARYIAYIPRDYMEGWAATIGSPFWAAASASAAVAFGVKRIASP